MNIRRLGMVFLAWGSCLLVAAGWAGTVSARIGPHPPPGGRSPAVLAQPTPTGDRLAAPPTVENPSQADTGAQVFWLNCQPCHGDIGQGLTEDWISQYPPEDQNCWESGCHGDRPYEDGFTLPHFVPAVIGPGALARFASAADLYGFIHQAMPYNAPGSLSEAEYWELTAFLMRANGLPPAGTPSPAAPLADATQAAQIGLHGPLATATPAATPTSVPAPGLGSGSGGLVLVVGGGLVLVALGALAWVRARRSRPSA